MGTLKRNNWRVGIAALTLVGLTSVGVIAPGRAQNVAQKVSPTTSLKIASPTDAGAAPIDTARDVGFDQRLNAQVPMDTVLRDENGKPFKIGEAFRGKPIILVMPFFKCTGACTLELNSLVKVFQDKKFGFDIGKEFNVVTLSIDAKESPELASGKKNEYIEDLGLSGVAPNWHFLTGTQPAIDAICQAVGFRYKYNPQNGQPIHVAGITVLTPQGKVSQYFMGADYHPLDLRLSLVEASENRIGSIADNIILLCVHFDPVTGRYGVVVMKVVRLAFIFTSVILVGAIWLMLRRDRYRTAKSLPPSMTTGATGGTTT